VQLYEVETTLIKYNKTLYSLISGGVDWAEFNIGVDGISRGLRANKCVMGVGNEKIESDTEELVRDKKFFGSEGVSGYSDIFSKSEESVSRPE